MSEIELLPCPFCGRNADLQKERLGFGVVCRTEECYGNQEHHWFTPEIACNEWNKRADSPQIAHYQRMIEMAREAFKNIAGLNDCDGNSPICEDLEECVMEAKKALAALETAKMDGL